MALVIHSVTYLKKKAIRTVSSYRKFKPAHQSSQDDKHALVELLSSQALTERGGGGSRRAGGRFQSAPHLGGKASWRCF